MSPMQLNRRRTEEMMKRSNRTLIVQLRMSPEEKKAFEALAEKLGTNLSELLRQLAHRALRAEKQGQAA